MAVSKSSSDEQLLAAIAYVGWWVTGIILLVLKKDSNFVRFHAMQSTFAFAGFNIAIVFLSFIPQLWILLYFVWLVAFIVWMFLMVKAFSGERYHLPYIGELAENQLAKMA